MARPHLGVVDDIETKPSGQYTWKTRLLVLFAPTIHIQTPNSPTPSTYPPLTPKRIGIRHESETNTKTGRDTGNPVWVMETDWPGRKINQLVGTLPHSIPIYVCLPLALPKLMWLSPLLSHPIDISAERIKVGVLANATLSHINRVDRQFACAWQKGFPFQIDVSRGMWAVYGWPWIVRVMAWPRRTIQQSVNGMFLVWSSMEILQTGNFVHILKWTRIFTSEHVNFLSNAKMCNQRVCTHVCSQPRHYPCT